MEIVPGLRPPNVMDIVPGLRPSIIDIACTDYLLGLSDHHINVKAYETVKA